MLRPAKIHECRGEGGYCTCIRQPKHMCVHYPSLSWVRSIQFIPHPTPRRSILILSSHLPFGLPSGSFRQVYPPKLCIHLSLSTYRLHTPPISFSSILSSKQYRVIHKSVKHLKNSQQMDYATDHGNSYVDRERNCWSSPPPKEKPAHIVALICR